MEIRREGGEKRDEGGIYQRLPIIINLSVQKKSFERDPVRIVSSAPLYLRLGLLI